MAAARISVGHSQMENRPMPRPLGALAALAATVALALGTLVTPALADGGRTLFITSAVEDGHGHASLPLHTGTSHLPTGEAVSVSFIILDTSSGDLSSRLGVNNSQKLANAANTSAVQRVTINPDGSWNFPATVDFAPMRMVSPGPTGFPPAAASPGAVGFTNPNGDSYSPLVQLPDGTIVNAPHIANRTGQADKALKIDTVARRVTMEETDGFQGGNPVRYISTDASDPLAATLENATFAPKLNGAPTVGDDSTDSSRASLAAFVNGQTGANNPQRQGLNSALLDGLSPLNVLRWNPSQGRYSPLWDVHLAAWTQAAINAGQNLRQTDWGTIQGLVDHGLITGLNGGPFVANGFIVDCPIVSSGR
jgi:hypothetical protein